MKIMSLYTQSYEQTLRSFMEEESEKGGLTVRYEGRRGDLFYINCAFMVFPEDAFVCLLEHVAAHENPVYRHSEKLMAMAMDLRKTGVHTENIRRLRQYIRHSRSLHLEGYTVFRMAEYRNKLDMMTYSLIKTCLKTP